MSSFGVHLQALVDLASLLGGQVEELQLPVRAVGEITGRPELPLGSFAEAYSLSDDHADLAAQLADLLVKLRQAEEFATTATRIVAERYRALDASGGRLST